MEQGRRGATRTDRSKTGKTATPSSPACSPSPAASNWQTHVWLHPCANKRHCWTSSTSFLYFSSSYPSQWIPLHGELESGIASKAVRWHYAHPVRINPNQVIRRLNFRIRMIGFSSFSSAISEELGGKNCPANCVGLLPHKRNAFSSLVTSPRKV